MSLRCLLSALLILAGSRPLAAQENDWHQRLDSSRIALRAAMRGSEEEAKALLAMGRALRMLDRSDTAVIVARSLIASLDTTPSALLVSAYDMLGRAQAETGDAGASMFSSQRALRTARAVNDTLGIRSALYQMGMANFNANRFIDALFYAQQLLPLLEGTDDPRHAGSLNMIGNVYYVRQEFDSATVFYTRAMDEARRIGSPQAVTLVGNLAGVYAEIGQADRGVALVGDELARNPGMEDRDRMNLLNVRGYCLYEMGRYAEAIADLRSSEAINDSLIHELDRSIDNLTYLAASYSGQGDFRSAFLSMEKLEAAKDSFHLNEQNTATLELEKRFQGELKQEHIERLSAETREKSERIKRQDQLLYAALAVLALVIAMAVLVWRNLRQKRKHARVLEALNVELKEQKERIEEINRLLQLKVLRTQMNPHFIYNSLNAIHNLVRNGEAVSASAYLDGFARLLRMVLDHSVKDHVPLEDEIAFLRQYLKLEALRFEDGVNYSVDADPQLLHAEDDVLVPTLIVQPFVENAVWHGLAPKQGEKKLSVRFTERDGKLICTVEDNGVGRDAAPKRSHPDGSASVGLQLTTERLQLLAYKLGGTGRVVFTDLMNGDSPSGTRVEVVLSNV